MPFFGDRVRRGLRKLEREKARGMWDINTKNCYCIKKKDCAGHLKERESFCIYKKFD